MISESDGSADSDRFPVATGRADHRAPVHRQLPPYLVAGNRFASAGLACGVAGLASAITDSLQLVAWLLAVSGVVLSGTGFVKYCQRGASNRDAAVLGAALAWVALVILLTRASVALQIPMSTLAP